MASNTRPLPYMCTKVSNRKRVETFNKECVNNGVEPDWDNAWGYIGRNSEHQIVVKLSWPDLKGMSLDEIREYVKIHSTMWPFL